MADNINQHDRHEGIVMGWHGKTVVTPDLSLDNNWLTRWDLVPREIKDSQSGELLPWKYLRCSDDETIRIGQPYNPDTFKPIDNRDFLDLVKKCIGGTKHKVASVGSVRNRARVFVSIELMGMEEFKAAGRHFGAFLNFGNGHDKSSILWVNTSSVCTVCDNTFTLNLIQVENKDSSKGNLNIGQRHTKNAILRLPAIADIVDKAVGVQAEFKMAMDSLDSVACDKPLALFTGFLGRGLDAEQRKNGLSARGVNTAERMLVLFKDGAGNRGRTLADAFSAVTDYYTHESSGGTNTMRQVVSSEMGAARQNKQDFWNVINSADDRYTMVNRGLELITNAKAA